MPTETPSDQQIAHYVHTPAQGLASRIAFRFCFVYFSLYCLGTQIITSLLSIPNVEIPDLATFWPMRSIVFAAGRLFRVSATPNFSDTGSGDRRFDWLLVFCLLVTSIVATAVWSYLDRNRESYATLAKWFRVFLRFALAGQLISYGLVKAVPLQMPFPYLGKLVEPFGDFSPMGVLWSSIGVSPAYETFAGCAELLGGVLLIFPRTTMLGALISLADMIQVFTLEHDLRRPCQTALVSFDSSVATSACARPSATGTLLLVRSQHRAFKATSALSLGAQIVSRSFVRLSWGYGCWEPTPMQASPDGTITVVDRRNLRCTGFGMWINFRSKVNRIHRSLATPNAGIASYSKLLRSPPSSAWTNPLSISVSTSKTRRR